MNSTAQYTIILSGDCLILFEHIEENKAKIVFWCSLYAITDIQIIQSLKSATINFYEDKDNKDFSLRLYIENIVLFRDTLITKMKALDIKISVKIIDSNSEKDEKKRLTIKDMSRMKLEDMEQNIHDIKSSIDKGEIEELNKSFREEDVQKQKNYENMMKEVIKMEIVDELNENILKNKKKEDKKDDNTENNNNEDKKDENIEDNNNEHKNGENIENENNENKIGEIEENKKEEVKENKKEETEEKNENKVNEI